MLVAITVTSCIPSLFPLYKTSDLKTDSRLEGTWRELGDTGYTWEVINPGRSKEHRIFGMPGWDLFDSLRTYRLTSRSKDDMGCQFAVHVFTLGGQDYLNYYPVDWEVDHDFLSWHLVETNIFSKVDIRKDTLIIRFFDSDFLEKLITGQKIKISYLKLDDRILLMAPTDELQQFVLKYGRDAGAFIEPDTLIRVSTQIAGR